MAKKEVTPKLRFTIRLNKQYWVVNLYTKGDFESKWPDDVGIAKYDHTKIKGERGLHFKGPRVCKDTIAHELLHAYFSYTDFSKLSEPDMEEKMCEIMGKKYKTLYALTEAVYVRLTKSNKLFSYIEMANALDKIKND